MQVCAVGFGDSDQRVSLVCPADVGIAAAVVRSRRAIVVFNAPRHPEFSPLLDNATGCRTASVLCAPVLCGADGRVLGVLELSNPPTDELQPFSDSDQAALAAACSELSPLMAALEEARPHEVDDAALGCSNAAAAELRAELVAGLTFGLNRAAAEHAMRPFLSGLLDATIRTLQADAALLMEVRDGALMDALCVADSAATAVGDGVAGRVAASGAALVLNDARSDPRFDEIADRPPAEHSGKLALASVPVTDGRGGTVGVMQLWKSDGKFSDTDQPALASHSMQMGALLALTHALDVLHGDALSWVSALGVAEVTSAAASGSQLFAEARRQLLRVAAKRPSVRVALASVERLAIMRMQRVAGSGRCTLLPRSGGSALGVAHGDGVAALAAARLAMATAAPQFMSASPISDAELAVPIKLDGEMLGILQLSGSKAENGAVREALEGVASDVAAALAMGTMLSASTDEATLIRPIAVAKLDWENRAGAQVERVCMHACVRTHVNTCMCTRTHACTHAHKRTQHDALLDALHRLAANALAAAVREVTECAAALGCCEPTVFRVVRAPLF